MSLYQEVAADRRPVDNVYLTAVLSDALSGRRTGSDLFYGKRQKPKYPLSEVPIRRWSSFGK
jgi:hypothetical protein